MGLKSKDNDHAPSNGRARNETTATPDEPRPPKVNAEVEKRLNPYIDANQNDFEREATLNRKQIAGAKEWLEKQPENVQEFIGRQLESVTHPAQKDMRMLQLVLNRMRIDNSRALAASPGGPAGMKVA